MNMDAIPAPDYTEFFEQRQRWLPHSQLRKQENLWVLYESSRGCWWGQKHHCTFCGLNGETMSFRYKSAQRLLSDVKRLIENSPTKRVCMSDNIMPHSYFKTLLPHTATEIPEVTFFYEIKANLSLKDVVALKQGGVTMVQPGIESLSSPCLNLMKKGVSGRQNINLLRYAKAAEVWLGWNILFALPGDEIAEYEMMLEVIPLLHHLQPPMGMSHLSLERFSPYFFDAEAYGIEAIRPIAAYHALFPPHADVAKLAYHFRGDYSSDSKSKANRVLMRRLEAEVERWREAWMSEEVPALALTELGNDVYLVLDTRGLPGTQEMYLILPGQARLIVAGVTASADDLAWALERKLVIEFEGRILPLVTAVPALFQQLLDKPARSEEKGHAQAKTAALPVSVSSA